MKTVLPLIVIAAALAERTRHYDINGFAINRREYRRRYGKRKGGGHGKGSIEKLWYGAPSQPRGRGQ